MEDEDGYMSIDPAKRMPSKQMNDPPKPPPNLLCWKISLGISLAGVVGLTLVVIFLSLPTSQVSTGERIAKNQIQSCVRKCTPCWSATDSNTANLTLDPRTNYPQLYLSDNLKNVRWKGMKQHLSSDSLRYDVMASVLSREGFTSGRICWEVEVVKGGTWWGVGIVRGSANRNGQIVLEPSGGYWGVQLIHGQYQAITGPRTNLTLCHQPTRIRVSLDYSEGQIAFFDGDTGAELFRFPKAHFSGERLHAWLLIDGWNGELTLHP